MLKKVTMFCLAVVFVISLNGCATGRRQKNLEIQGLKNQVSILESQIQSKDEEINNLRDELSRTSQEKIATVKYSGKKKVVGEVKSRPNVKQIQIALRNAGFDPGIADGRMGRQTRNSIRAFQRAHNLGVDGKVGRRTWSLLKEYLYKKTK